jgi:hypothetical protein
VGGFHWNFLKNIYSCPITILKLDPEIQKEPPIWPPEAEFLFMDGFQILQSHQRQGGISIWIFSFNSQIDDDDDNDDDENGPKIKKFWAKNQ